MALKWLVNIEGGGGVFVAKSISRWQSGYHNTHPKIPHSEAEAGRELDAIKTHGYFSVMIDERHALQKGTTVPGTIHSLFARLPKQEIPGMTNVGGIGSLLKELAGPTTFSMTIALSRSDGNLQTVVLSLAFEAVQVTNYVASQDGYTFDFMVRGKTREEFLRE